MGYVYLYEKMLNVTSYILTVKYITLKKKKHSSLDIQRYRFVNACVFNNIIESSLIIIIQTLQTRNILRFVRFVQG